MKKIEFGEARVGDYVACYSFARNNDEMGGWVFGKLTDRRSDLFPDSFYLDERLIVGDVDVGSWFDMGMWYHWDGDCIYYKFDSKEEMIVEWELLSL